MLILQAISAFLLLFNKIYVFKKKTIGWTFGIWGTIAITAYFYLQMKYENRLDLWVMVVYDAALLPLMIYGYLISSSTTNSRTRDMLKKWGLVFKVVLAVITICICTFLVYQAAHAQLVFVQFLSTLFGLSGTLLLAINVKALNIAGWISYFFAHSFVTYLAIETGSPVIALCQILSGFVSYFGIKRELKNE